MNAEDVIVSLEKRGCEVEYEEATLLLIRFPKTLKRLELVRLMTHLMMVGFNIQDTPSVDDEDGWIVLEMMLD